MNNKNAVNSFIGSIVIFSLALITIPNAARAAAQLPSQVQPGRIEKKEAPKPKEPSAPEAPITVPEAAPEIIPSEASRLHFTLKNVELVGNTVYSAAIVKSFWRQLEGKNISLAQIYGVAGEITARYRTDGYILSQAVVPAQDIVDGKVKIRVVEGFIDKVDVKDESGRSLGELVPYLDKVRGERPLKGSTLERYVLLINDLSGYYARAYLQRSQTPGAANLTVVVNKSSFDGSIAADSRVSKLLGDAEFTTSVGFNDVLGIRERDSLRWVTTNNNSLDLYGYNGVFPLGHNGFKVSLDLSTSRTTPDVGNALDLKTDSDGATLMLAYPLVRSRQLNLTLRGGINGFNSSTDSAGLLIEKYRTRVIKIAVRVDKVDAAKGINQMDVEVSRGVKGLGALSDDYGNPARLDFKKYDLYAARLQSLVSRLSMLIAVSGQYSNDLLYSSERIGIGGDQFLRAYDNSELLGDSGVAGKLELRYDLPVSRALIMVYLFADTGKVWQKVVGSQTMTDHANSVGGGIRFSVASHLNGYMELAKPCAREVATEGNKDNRVFGGLSIVF